MHAEPKNKQLTVVLTAYNDEQSIGDTVTDFLSHPRTRRVIVNDNSSADRTVDVARSAGAEVVLECSAGYERCVFRASAKVSRRRITDLTLLCEGDITFRAFDIDKFMVYIPHVNIVNGTRIVEQFRRPERNSARSVIAEMSPYESSWKSGI